MFVFALDSSGATASAALAEDERVLASAFSDTGLTHSETLLPLCDEVFKRAGLTPSDVGCFAVTCGPGSFTGLRIGIGTIKGMCYANPAALCAAVPTTQALARGAALFDGIAVPVMDARQGRVYFSAFGCGSSPERLLEDDTAKIEDLPEFLSGFEKPLIFVGDASAMCYNKLKDRLDCRDGGAVCKNVRAEQVAAAALELCAAGKTVSGAGLSPFYLQLPSAQRILMEKEKK